MAFMALWGRAALSPFPPLTPRASPYTETVTLIPDNVFILLFNKWESVYLTEMPRSDDCVVCPTGRRLHICLLRLHSSALETTFLEIITFKFKVYDNVALKLGF